MGFFSNLFGKGKNKQSEVEKGNIPLRDVDNSLALYQEAVDIIVVSDILRDELKVKLQQAFDNPQSFYDESSEFILSDRGLFYPKDVLLTPKFVFIDTLIDNGQMAEVDWKAAEEDIRWAINGIAKAKGYELRFSSDDKYEDQDTYTVIDQINDEELQPAGYSLEILDINSDSYVFTIVPLGQHTIVAALFGKMK